MYKKCERRRNVLEDTMKKRIECMEYMANNCIPADDMFQLGVKLNNKLYDEEEEELSAPGRYNWPGIFFGGARRGWGGSIILNVEYLIH